MDILDINKCEKDNFSIKNFDKKYTLKYNNKVFLIIMKIIKHLKTLLYFYMMQLVKLQN